MGIGKGAYTHPKIVETFAKAGLSYYGDSRLNKLIQIKERNIDISLALIRLPQEFEISNVVKYTDLSFNSEIKTLEMLNKAAFNQDKIHKVFIMVEMGDLREGIYPLEDVIKICLLVKQMNNLKLEGIAANFSCYGGIMPDNNKMNKLVALSDRIESKIGLKINNISGGSTTSLPLVLDEKIPVGINHLRLGEALLLGRDLKDIWRYPLKNIHSDTFLLKAQVIEVKRKPSKPYGKAFVDAFGNKPQFPDEGIRKRAILAVGKADLVYPNQLIPCRKGVKILGASSDHLIIDVEDVKPPIKVGDILSFQLFFGPLLHLSRSPEVKKVIYD